MPHAACVQESREAFSILRTAMMCMPALATQDITQPHVQAIEAIVEALMPGITKSQVAF